MRCSLLLACMLLVLPISECWAQDAPESESEAATPAWTIQIDPLTVALGFVHIQVEWAFSEHVSVYAGPSLKLFRSFTEDSPYPYQGWGGEVGVRWFVLGVAPEGWWVQVRGVLAYLTADPPEGGQLTDVGGYLSALGGYTAIFDGWFVLSGGLGVQYLYYTVGESGIRGVLPAAHTTLGVAF